MSANANCIRCGYSVKESQDRCSSCGTHFQFPNVRAASQIHEQAALNKRYATASANVDKKDSEIRESFESAVGQESKAVIATNIHELHRLVDSETQIFATYYDRLKAGIVHPTGDKWHVWRTIAEASLFPGYHETIRFAALSLDGTGLSHYGMCFLTIKTVMIEERASLFVDNNVIHTVFQQAIAMKDAVNLEPGHRAVWEDRHKLCLIKVAPDLDAESATDPGFPKLILERGDKPEDDRFVEVHIWGPLNINSVERVVIGRSNGVPTAAAIEELKQLLEPFGLEPEEEEL